jgi:RHS repeat-associated protein
MRIILFFIFLSHSIFGLEIVLLDGSGFICDLLNETDKSYKILYKEREYIIPKADTRLVDYNKKGKHSSFRYSTIVLKDGSKIYGVIAEDTINSLTVKTELGFLTFEKSKIAEFPEKTSSVEISSAYSASNVKLPETRVGIFASSYANSNSLNEFNSISFGGKSSINYKPYGEINRTDSSGPDISKFKYTGQEEDKESGLLYYKARYYDPILGRFISADDLTVSNDLYGQNKYMYVRGNPVLWVDRDGKWCSKNTLGVVLFMVGGPIATGIGGVVYNYTGGGGSCSQKEPDELGALYAFFLPDLANSSQSDFGIKVLGIFYYYQFQKSRGEPTFINSVSRKDLGMFLAYNTLKNSSEENIQRNAYIWYLMTNKVAKPAKGLDQASYWHDQYGSRPADPNNRRANNQWIKNAWKRARGPDQIVTAAIGTVLFKAVNFLHDITHVKYERYKDLKLCTKGCNYFGNF